MFGELALSEKAFADHGILTLGSATADANFTLGQAATYIGVDAAEMSAIAVKLSVGSGILTGLIDATLEFTQSSAGTRFATGISGQVFSTLQTSDGVRFATGISEQDAAFIQSAAANTILSGISEQEAAFIASTIGGILKQSPARLEAVFVQTTNSVAVLSGVSEQEASFTLNATGGKLFDKSLLEISSVFVQTTDGRLLWERINADIPRENWTEINPAGGTWTEINAGAIISNWTEKVV